MISYEPLAILEDELPTWGLQVIFVQSKRKRSVLYYSSI
jgi:hypothetical protein